MMSNILSVKGGDLSILSWELAILDVQKLRSKANNAKHKRTPQILLSFKSRLEQMKMSLNKCFG